MKAGDDVIKWPFIGTIRAIGRLSDGVEWALCEEVGGEIFISPVTSLRAYRGPQIALVPSKA